ncbi:MAG: malate dehydrogenase [Phycisphaerae bacterium]|nr:malate dehydrogenase [Phycisphaerae bacterium]
MSQRAKVTIVGAGNVGATCAHWLASWRVADLVLIDVVEGMPQGKALDLAQSGPVEGYDLTITGTNDYADTAGSDVVVITAGLARKPGMSRDELLAANTKIVKTCAENAVRHSPEAIFVVVSNPLDAMVYTAWKASGVAPRKIVGQAGVLDVARYKTFLAMELNCSVQDISALLIGGHGDDMVPLPRYTSVGGIPVTDLVPADRLAAIVERTRKGGGEIVSLLKTGSAYYTPASASARMVESILRDQKRVMPCAAYCESEYGISGYFVGVPCMLGRSGVEKVFELKLTADETAAFAESISHVRELCGQVDKLLVQG